GLEKVIKIDVISVPFSGHLLPTLTLVKPLLTDPRFRIRVITGCQKKELVEEIGFDCLALFPERPTVMEDIANTPQQSNLLIAYQQFRANSRLIPEVINELNRIW
ncbi:MAG: glycosyltransferase, partial [Streptococcus sp.]